MRTVNSDSQNLVQMMVSLPPTLKINHEKIEINAYNPLLCCIDAILWTLSISVVCNLDVTDDTTEKN